MKDLNIPLAIKHIGDNAIDPNNSYNVRFNYIQTLKNIRDYSSRIINEFEKTDLQKRKKEVRR